MNASNNSAAVNINQSNNDLSAYQTYKQTRLATQQSELAYQLDYMHVGDLFADQLHNLSFGTAH